MAPNACKAIRQTYSFNAGTVVIPRYIVVIRAISHRAAAFDGQHAGFGVEGPGQVIAAGAGVGFRVGGQGYLGQQGQQQGKAEDQAESFFKLFHLGFSFRAFERCFSQHGSV